jgi:SEC-C motif-containing protein
MRSIRAFTISEAAAVIFATAPADLIRQRFSDLKSGNFAALYHSYDAQSPFLQQFPSLQEYLEFAAQVLVEMKPLQVLIGDQRNSEEGVELICQLSFELGGTTQILYELALVVRAEEGWRYHSAQKLTSEEYAGPFSGLDFSTFDRQPLKIRF